MHQSFDDFAVTRVDSCGRSRNWRWTSRARVACRYARMFCLSLSEAARDLGLAATTVSATWREIYPEVPALKSRRAS
jgi:hypothetical protein